MITIDEPIATKSTSVASLASCPVATVDAAVIAPSVSISGAVTDPNYTAPSSTPDILEIGGETVEIGGETIEY